MVVRNVVRSPVRAVVQSVFGEGESFHPFQLFTSGAQGAWYDPSDYSTLYQDAAGTTPVTAVEQPVRLMLDRSRGLVLGSELVTNGDFSDGMTGWTQINGSGVVVGGVCTFTPSANFGSIRRAVTLVVGKSYQFTATVAGNSLARFYLGGTSGTALGTPGTTASTMLSVVGVATSTSGEITLDSGDSATPFTITNISVRELPGNHALAPNDASRPVLRSRYNLLTRSEEFDDGAWLKQSNGTGSAPVVTANAAVAPDGTMTADQVAFALNGGTSGSDLSVLNQQISSTITLAGSFWVRASSNVRIAARASTTWRAIDATTTWQRVVLPADTGAGLQIGLRGSVISGLPDTATVEIWGAQLLTAADHAATGGAYQRVGSATDYDTGPPWRPYLAFDGSDDSMSTSSIDFNTVTSDGQPRRNLLLNPTQFDAAAWTQVTSSVAANASAAPDGTTTADKVIPSIGATAGRVQQSLTVLAATTYTISVYAKADGFNFFRFRVDVDSADSVYFDLLNGTVGAREGRWSSSSIQSVGNGWYRLIATYTTVGTAYSWRFLPDADGAGNTVGDGTSGVLLWGAQLETGSSATAFQNIGTDKMTVFAGVSKLSDAATAMLWEFSDSSAVNNGTFALLAPNSTNEYAWRSKGTLDSLLNVDNAAYAAPVTHVLTGIGDISGDVATLRVNGVQAATSATDQGTGNFGNYPLFIGRRNNASLPFNGRLYGLTVLGRTATAPELTAMETWIAGKTGVSL